MSQVAPRIEFSPKYYSFTMSLNICTFLLTCQKTLIIDNTAFDFLHKKRSEKNFFSTLEYIKQKTSTLNFKNPCLFLCLSSSKGTR